MQAGNVQHVGRADRRAKAFPRLGLIGLALLMSSQSFASCRTLPRTVEASGNHITWAPCGGGLECGKLVVPLDYSNPKNGTATLALARYPAPDRDRRLGTLMTNPGGPGVSGVGFMYQVGQQLSQLLDGRYDIVSWDPRGIGETTPQVQCFDSQTDQDIFFANSQKEVVPPSRNLADPANLAIYRSHVRVADARNAALAQLCHKKTGEALRHVGTATVVRDLEFIYNILEGNDKKINYYGFSYGTVVGSYLVNMFPNRVGKVAIDGVVDPDMWANHHSVEWLKHDSVDSEKVLGNFFKACADAGPQRCALASPGSTAASLYTTFTTLLNNLYEKPLPVANATRPGVLTEGAIRALAASYITRPRDWPQFAKVLAAAIHGDGAPILNERDAKIELNQTKPAATAMAITAVTCVDTPSFDRMTPDAAFKDMMDEIVKGEKVSPHFAPLGIDMCQHWQARETERFTGPFNHTLSNPILVIGNTADPNTPLVNARAVKGYLGNSARLLIQDGSGHCSQAMTSMCTLKTVREHFIDGKLPQDGTVCATDEQLFPPASHSKRSPNREMSADDLQLFQRATELGEAITKHGAMFKGPRSLMF